ncbi:CKLF-like MARVEL transmembrane domain-containing protein 3 [Ornithorhynchus anatinus]|uniref:CKLF like MARVEL transmembrane domain containing 3 n=1 Tax=Ornithorhynchus anatinus TaxID=9258 RepID=A0A6I8NFQ5_ORNAN|nr:CKLF-like MARVEL transmembrane domain-containing protein 3 [Ornithorhynchus anatinus]
MWSPGDSEQSPPPAAPPPGLRSLLASRDFVCSRKGRLLLGESGLSFIIFICYIASNAAAFMTAPLLAFLLALCYFFAYSTKLNEKFRGIYWPLMDFLRCVTAAIIYFAISITAVSKYTDGASKAAGVFGFVATIVYALDFYIIFNDLAKFLKQGDANNDPEVHKSEDEDSDSD